jgi:hypothetical protein
MPAKTSPYRPVGRPTPAKLKPPKKGRIRPIPLATPAKGEGKREYLGRTMGKPYRSKRGRGMRGNTPYKVR